jgi:hypothetical protein
LTEILPKNNKVSKLNSVVIFHSINLYLPILSRLGPDHELPLIFLLPVQSTYMGKTRKITKNTNREVNRDLNMPIHRLKSSCTKCGFITDVTRMPRHMASQACHKRTAIIARDPAGTNQSY